MSPGAGIRGRQNRREIINSFANAKLRTGTYGLDRLQCRIKQVEAYRQSDFWGP